MNQLFSFKRYAWLMKRQFVENKKIYFWGIGAIVACVALMFMTFIRWDKGEYFDHEPVFGISCFIFMLFYAGTFCEPLNSKYKGMFYFSLPATPLERLAVIFSYVMVLFPAVLLSILYVEDYLAVAIFNSIHGAQKHLLSLFALEWKVVLVMPQFVSGIALCSFMLGRAGILKAGFLFFIGMLLSFLIASGVYNLIIPAHISNIEWNGVWIEKYQTTLSVDSIYTQAWYLLAPVCWVVFYFKLKEKEV
ncbi:MAG: hypothetical protein LBT78_05505 [Tannerella sp.]|jgi:hypothetical protein|nr:hypothetical protein [Tannerella sp.]